MTEVHEALRRWAKGLYPLEAGVELLIHAFDGRFANPSQPWVQQGDDPGWRWIDAEQMTEDNYGALSGGETRFLRIAASLLDGQPVNLSRSPTTGATCNSSSRPSPTPAAATNPLDGWRLEVDDL